MPDMKNVNWRCFWSWKYAFVNHQFRHHSHNGAQWLCGDLSFLNEVLRISPNTSGTSFPDVLRLKVCSSWKPPSVQDQAHLIHFRETNQCSIKVRLLVAYLPCVASERTTCRNHVVEVHMSKSWTSLGSRSRNNMKRSFPKIRCSREPANHKKLWLLLNAKRTLGYKQLHWRWGIIRRLFHLLFIQRSSDPLTVTQSSLNISVNH